MSRSSIFAAIALALASLSTSATAQSVSASKIASFEQQSEGSLIDASLMFSIALTPIAGQGGGFAMLFSGAAPADGVVHPVLCFHVPVGPNTTSASMGNNPGSAPKGFSWVYSSGANCQTKVAAVINFVSIAYR